MSTDDRERLDPLTQALRALPRERASEDFARRLLEQTAAGPTPRSRQIARSRWVAAAVLVLAVLGGFYAREQLRELETRNQRRALLERHLELRRELAELQERVSEPPTLYVGAASDFDVVVNLGPWLEQAAVQPAAYTTGRQ